MPQYLSRNFLRIEHPFRNVLALQDYEPFVVLVDVIREIGLERFGFFVGESRESLHRIERVFRIRTHPVQSRMSNQNLSIGKIRDHRWNRAVPVGIRNNFRLSVHEHGNGRIGGSEVDADVDVL
mmetsp:Transcript_4099/g.25822  ORF Transcript_4099/g.25822 Transcript_4099/m.25822 type:complete len:124 (-) Transcript_4099:135-506(-)